MINEINDNHMQKNVDKEVFMIYIWFNKIAVPQFQLLLAEISTYWFDSRLYDDYLSCVQRDTTLFYCKVGTAERRFFVTKNFTAY